MPITDKTRQPLGLLHGGINMVLAESAASLHAVWGIDLNEVNPVGVEISGSHVQSAKEGTVRAEGNVISRTRSFIVHQVDIYHQETEKLLSSVRVRVYYKKIAKDN
jgi:1,4-dihydroxy-2-naphthoyl-CoA hydrolase